MSYRRNRRRKNRLWLVAAGAAVPVAAAAVLITQAGAPHSTTHLGAKPAAYVGGMPMGGFGRGGYPMTGGAQGQQALGNAGTSNSANAAATSTNWSGYAAAGQPGQFTSVSSSWTQPTVTCSNQQTFSSFWVGLDGDGTQSVEQTGTEADCDNGNAAYQGWWEMFPAAPVFYNNPVKPGDAMSASVVSNGGGAFTLTLSDTTENWTQTTQQTSTTAQDGSAEVIAEAPSSQNGVLPLSNFGTVNFSGAQADNAPIGNANADSLTMVSANGVTEATPSALTGGNAFSVTFGANAGAAPAPSGAAPSGAAPSPSGSVAPSTGGSPAPAPSTSTTGTGTGDGSGYHHHHHWFWW